jgi:hypothetical protein
MRARNVGFEPDLPFVPHDGVSQTHDQFRGTVGGPMKGAITAEFPMTGSGSAGTAPAIDPILEAMGFLGVNTPSTSEVYKPTVGGVAMTLHLQTAKDVTDGYKMMIHGSRASGSFVLNAGETPILTMRAEGLYNEPTEVNMLATPNFEDTYPVANCGSTFTIDSVAMKYKNFTITIENELADQEDITDATALYSIAIAKQRFTFALDPLMEDPATYNFFSKLTANTEVALALTIGGTAGNIIAFAAAKMQFTDIKIGNRDGMVTAETTGQLNRNTDNDPACLSVTFT